MRQVRTLFAAGTATGLSDSELLARYKAKRAESAEAATAAEMAFAALVDRHGAMVWGICHRLLRDVHDAEDAFQATFLILIRKAGSVRVDGSLGRWLYGVARRVALRARSEAARRGQPLGQREPASSDDPLDQAELSDCRNVVGEELDRLPAKYRCSVELCHLHGMTYDQAARQLNWPVATVKNRLIKGRLKLRTRLTQRGLAPGAVAAGLAKIITPQARAAVPPELVRSTARAAAANSTVALKATVMELTEGVLKMMMWQKLRLTALGVLAAIAVTAPAMALSKPVPITGALAVRPQQAAAQPTEKTDEKKSGDRRWIRRLASGAIIEVIAVSTFPSGPDTWWRPDGTPLEAAPCDPREPGIAGGDGDVRKLVIVRLARIPEGANYECSIVGAGWADRPAMRGGKPLPGLTELTALLSADADTCTIRFKVASGPWQTVQTWGNNPGGRASAFGPSFIFGDAIATPKGTTLSVTHTILDRPVRLMALDVDGKEFPATVRSGTSVKDFQQLVVEFELPPDQIKEFRVQTRPFEEVDVRDVALKRK